MTTDTVMFIAGTVFWGLVALNVIHGVFEAIGGAM